MHNFSKGSTIHHTGERKLLGEDKFQDLRVYWRIIFNITDV